MDMEIYRKISYGKPEFLVFYMVDKFFILIHVVTLTFEFFHVVDKMEVFLLSLRYF